MAKSADIGGKRLISLAPDAWVQWVTQRSDVTARDILASEFQWISRESDVVVRAYSPQLGKFLVLNELQLRYTPKMPQRMRAYAALAEERYGLSVYPVLGNILPPAPATAIATCYDSQFMGLKAHQDYHVINLWEIDAEIIFQQQLSSLLPFAPVFRGGGKAAIVQQALQRLRADETLRELEPLLAFFASFVLELPVVQQIMRWDMTVLRESPWYEEILKEGLEQGMQQGLQQGLLQGLLQGMQQGLQQGLLAAIEVSLKQKFGDQGLQLLPQIRQVSDVQQLQDIQAALIKVNTLEEFQQTYSNLFN